MHDEAIRCCVTKVMQGERDCRVDSRTKSSQESMIPDKCRYLGIAMMLKCHGAIESREYLKLND